MRSRLCRVCRGWHEPSNWPVACLADPVERSAFPTPMVNVDGMEPVRSMVDGLMYDSKSALRRTYKQHGMVEVGNEPIKAPEPIKPKSNPEAVVRAMKRAGVWDQLSD